MTKTTLIALAAVALTSFTTIAQAQVLTHVPNYPGKPTPSTVNCDSHLGYMRRVYPEQVQGIDTHYRVWVTELCDSFGMLRSEGNAEYLRRHIAENPVLRRALGQKAYSSDDVFAVKMMGDDTIQLFVHHFGR